MLAAEAHLQSCHGSFQPAWQSGTISTGEGLTAYLLIQGVARLFDIERLL